MYAVLLNPPKKRKKRKKLSKACRSHIAKRAYRKGRRKKAAPKRRRKSRRARPDPFNALPSSMGGRSRRRNYSSWIPAYKNPGRKRRRKKTGKQSEAYEKGYYSGLEDARYMRPRSAISKRGTLYGKGYKAGYGAIGSNPGRKRRRSASYRYKGKRKRRKSRNYSTWIPAFSNPAWVPSYAMNPGGGIVANLTRGMKPATLAKAAPMAVGVVGNVALGRFVSDKLPAMFQSGGLNVVVNLATAGLLGAAAGMVKPSYAGPVFLGGIVEAITRAANEFILPALGLGGCMGCGLGDYAENMRTQAYLPSYEAATGLNTTGAEGLLGDYLTRTDAATARPLGGVHPTAVHDSVIDSVGAVELAG